MRREYTAWLTGRPSSSSWTRALSVRSGHRLGSSAYSSAGNHAHTPSVEIVPSSVELW